MRREWLASLVVLSATGCSWFLDFSDSAIPRDAGPDAPYSPAACAYKEPNDSVANAAPFAPDDTGPAAICPASPEDHDFYRLTVPAAISKVEIRIAFMARAGGDLDLKLYDKNGTLLSQSTGFVGVEAITCPGASPMCPALVADDYVFEVFPGLAGAVNEYAIGVAFTLAP